MRRRLMLLLHIRQSLLLLQRLMRRNSLLHILQSLLQRGSIRRQRRRRTV